MVRSWLVVALAAGACSFDVRGLQPPQGKDLAPAREAAGLDRASEGTDSDGPLVDGARPDARKADSARDRSPGEGKPVKPWWDPAFGKRRKLSFKNSGGSEDLAGFPLLVVLDQGRLGYSSVKAAGEDLRFVDADQVTVLPHEIEHWNTKGKSYLWVRVPMLDKASSADHLWLYYGNPQAAGAQNRAAVWSAGFLGVWHLHDLEDSTAAKNNATATGASASGGGRIAGAMSFDASKKQYLELPKHSTFAGLDQLSVELWVRTKQVWDKSYWPASATLLTRATPGGSSGDWMMLGGKNAGGTDGRLVIGVGVGGEPTISSTSKVNDDAYHYIVWTRTQGGQNELYLDGTKQASLKDAADKSIAADRPIQIGGEQFHSGGTFFEGLIDEVRISSAVRSPAWVDAQHRSMTDALLDYGPEELP